jgi:hypothetical protein
MGVGADLMTKLIGSCVCGTRRHVIEGEVSASTLPLFSLPQSQWFSRELDPLLSAASRRHTSLTDEVATPDQLPHVHP